jgi:hypothetical protein
MAQDQSKITVGIAILVAVLASRDFSFAILLIVFAVFLIVWGRDRQRTERFVADLPGGQYLSKGLHQLDLVLSPRDQEFEEHLRKVIAAYPPVLRASLARLKETRDARSIDEAYWTQFNNDGLVDHPHSGPGPIKDNLRDIIGRILDQLDHQ